MMINFKTMVQISLLFILLPAFGQEVPIENKIWRMMDALGTSKRFDIVLDRIIEQQREAIEYQMEDEFWVEFKKEIEMEGKKELIEQIIPIYIKYFSEDEIDSMLEFYESEIGQKIVSKFPLMTQELMEIGEEWGQKNAEKIVDKLQNSKKIKYESELKEDCSAFREGRFFNYLPDGSKVEIERIGNKQIEQNGDEDITFEIKWLSDCRYLIIGMQQLDPSYPSNTLEVNIYEVNEKSYKFITYTKEYDVYIEGEAFKIE